MDYYHFNIEEAPKTCSNILFCDIEIDAGIDNKAFPDPKKALYPINMISCIYQDQKKKVCYVLDNKTEPIHEQSGVDIRIFDTEKKMMLAFIKDVKDNDPDFMSGWNFIGFDMEYVFNRLPKIKIQQSSMSKFGEFYVDAFRYVCKLPGIIVLDQLHLYKMFNFTMKENYKLGTIGKDEVEMEKIKMEYAINEMYYKQLNKLIEYNIRDTDILEMIENKLGHINLINELRVICNASFDSAASNFGQIDTIIVSFLKEKGLASKNSDPHISKESYPGAYVHPPIPGVYDKICDFDFTSLYPSLISTYNIGVNCFKYKLEDPTQGYDLAYHPEQLPEQIKIIEDPTFKNKKIEMTPDDLIKEIKDNGYVFSINGCIYEGHKKNISIYSQVLESLLSSRREYKKKMLDAKEAGDKVMEDYYNTKQLVYKVLANSLYGVIANKAFRFFDLSCAGAITLSGQEALKRTLIEGDEYMRYMYKKDEYRTPKELTKKEMYSGKMPNRIPDYIITGDTDSIFVCFNDFKDATSDEKIKEYCDQLQDFLNNTIMVDIVNRHNINDLKYNKLDLKNELIISRGLFLAKKRYAINVTNNEGRVVDEMKYMGLEIKRSDYPSRSKELMKGLLKRIMKMKTVSAAKLEKFLETEKIEFIQLIKNGDKSIARPVTYGKKLKDYKTIPQGVKAMENFNSIAYKKFVTGDKGYMFRVRGVDLEKAPDDVKKNYEKNFIKKGKKLEVVAIPDEELCLPYYFIPDVKGNMQFAYEDRHELLMAPLKQGMKTAGLLTIS
jgi:DNA polymerase elongation subunit (family B)